MPLSHAIRGSYIIRNLWKNITNPVILKDFYNAAIECAKISAKGTPGKEKIPPGRDFGGR
jgi:hypothetical protein